MGNCVSSGAWLDFWLFYVESAVFGVGIRRYLVDLCAYFLVLVVLLLAICLLVLFVFVFKLDNFWYDLIRMVVGLDFGCFVVLFWFGLGWCLQFT